MLAAWHSGFDPNQAAATQDRRVLYRTAEGIVRFVREVLRADPAPYQEDILRLLVEHGRVAVHGPHGLGKTADGAWFVLWMIAVWDDVKVVTTASAWRQLTHYLWPEIRKWAKRGDWGLVGLELRSGKELLELSLKLGSREAFAAASDNADLIEGAHADYIAYVFDEAKAIPVDIWDAAEGAFATGRAFALAISTPGTKSGRFYEICARKPGFEDWKVRHVTLAEAIAAGRVDAEWAAKRRLQWGEESDVYQQRVLGEFADSSETQVIPLSWVERANDRWLDCQGQGPADLPVILGVDPAYTGGDLTAIAQRRGRVIESIEGYGKNTTMQTAGRVKATLDTEPGSQAYIDVIGIGAGVVDRLAEQNCKVTPVDVRHKTSLRDKTGLMHFKNLRSAIWWIAHEALDPESDDPIALPPDDRLTGDLTAPSWGYVSNGAIVVEEKEDIVKRLGRSPDFAEAVCLALYADAATVLEVMELDW